VLFGKTVIGVAKLRLALRQIGGVNLLCRRLNGRGLGLVDGAGLTAVYNKTGGDRGRRRESCMTHAPAPSPDLPGRFFRNYDTEERLNFGAEMHLRFGIRHTSH
jgi:hypothetical protein